MYMLPLGAQSPKGLSRALAGCVLCASDREQNMCLTVMYYGTKTVHVLLCPLFCCVRFIPADHHLTT